MITVGISLGLLICLLASLGHTVEDTTYLERGKTGFVHCSVVDKKAISPSDIDKVFWKKENQQVVSSYEPQNGKYFLDCSMLGIKNVTDEDRGLYQCALIVNGQSVQGSQNVSVFVVPVKPFPVIQDCPDVDSYLNKCLIVTTPGEVERNLTCLVNGSRPYIDLHWDRVWPDGLVERLNISNVDISPMQQAGQEPLFSSMTVLRLPLRHYDGATLRCVATGIATGQQNGSFTTIQIKAGAPVRTPSSWVGKAVISSLVTAAPLVFIIFVLCYKMRKKSRKSGDSSPPPSPGGMPDYQLVSSSSPAKAVAKSKAKGLDLPVPV